MRQVISVVLAGALLAMAGTGPASAAFSFPAAPDTNGSLIKARFGGGGHHHMGGHRFRRHGFGGHHRFGGRGFGGHRFGGHHFGHRNYIGPRYHHRYGGYYHRGYGGYGAGAGIAGLAAGALIGGALGAATHGSYGPVAGRTVGYCERHFKSYNRATHTYLGYDGRHHRCP